LIMEDPPTAETLAAFEKDNALAAEKAELLISSSPVEGHYYLGAANGFHARTLVARKHGPDDRGIRFYYEWVKENHATSLRELFVEMSHKADAVVLCAYETVRPEDKRWTGWTEGQMRKAHQGLAAIEREDLSSPRTIGHIAIGCMLGYLDLRFPDDGWRQRHPKLALWYKDFADLPGMKATRPPAS